MDGDAALTINQKGDVAPPTKDKIARRRDARNAKWVLRAKAAVASATRRLPSAVLERLDEAAADAAAYFAAAAVAAAAAEAVADAEAMTHAGRDVDAGTFEERKAAALANAKKQAAAASAKLARKAEAAAASRVAFRMALYAAAYASDPASAQKRARAKMPRLRRLERGIAAAELRFNDKVNRPLVDAINAADAAAAAQDADTFAAAAARAAEQWSNFVVARGDCRESWAELLELTLALWEVDRAPRGKASTKPCDLWLRIEPTSEDLLGGVDVYARATQAEKVRRADPIKVLRHACAQQGEYGEIVAAALENPTLMAAPVDADERGRTICAVLSRDGGEPHERCAPITEMERELIARMEAGGFERAAIARVVGRDEEVIRHALDAGDADNTPRAVGTFAARAEGIRPREVISFYRARLAPEYRDDVGKFKREEAEILSRVGGCEASSAALPEQPHSPRSLDENTKLIGPVATITWLDGVSAAAAAAVADFYVDLVLDIAPGELAKSKTARCARLAAFAFETITGRAGAGDTVMAQVFAAHECRRDAIRVELKAASQKNLADIIDVEEQLRPIPKETLEAYPKEIRRLLPKRGYIAPDYVSPPRRVSTLSDANTRALPQDDVSLRRAAEAAAALARWQSTRARIEALEDVPEMPDSVTGLSSAFLIQILARFSTRLEARLAACGFKLRSHELPRRLGGPIPPPPIDPLDFWPAHWRWLLHHVTPRA